jgi:hypothetical protein
MDSSKSLALIWVAVAKQLQFIKPQSIISFNKYVDYNPKVFLTQTLPLLGKAVDKALENGFLDLEPGIVKFRHKTVLPVFLNEYFYTFFTDDGHLRFEFDVHALKEFRTLCFMFYKFEFPFTKEQELLAYDKFKVLDESVKTDFSDIDISPLKTIFNQCLPDNPLDIRPRHSSGATADKISNIQKRQVRRYIPSLMETFPVTYFFQSYEHAKAHSDENAFLSVEPTSRVTLVPKDARGPRIICMEPHERMFIQQGLMHKIYEHIECYSPFKGRINFTDQTINQRLAYESSITRKYATIDMKDASDLVSWELIKRLVSPEWYEVLEATRSSKASLPDGSIVELKKFAPMGSALCFPIEAILFFAICYQVTTEVWVYGDDIIVPRETAIAVMDLLETYGLIVNRDKSLYRGFFQESCGGDFYKGMNINPVRLKSVDLDTFVSFANNLRRHLSDEIGEAAIRAYESLYACIVLRLPLQNEERSSFIAYYTNMPSNAVLFNRRFNKDLQRYELRSLCNVAKPSRRLSHNYDAMFDWFSTNETSNSPVEDARIKTLLKGVTHDKRIISSALDVCTSSGTVTISKKVTKYSWGDYIPS